MWFQASTGGPGMYLPQIRDYHIIPLLFPLAPHSPLPTCIFIMLLQLHLCAKHDFISQYQDACPPPPKGLLASFSLYLLGGLTVCQALSFLLGVTCTRITSSKNSNEEEDDHHSWSGHESPLLNTPCGSSHL